MPVLSICPPEVFIRVFPLAGIPQIYHFGQEGLHNILVIDLLGPSMEDLFDMCGRKFSIKTTCMAARQMVCFVIGRTGSSMFGATRWTQVYHFLFLCRLHECSRSTNAILYTAISNPIISSLGDQGRKMPI